MNHPLTNNEIPKLILNEQGKLQYSKVKEVLDNENAKIKLNDEEMYDAIYYTLEDEFDYSPFELEVLQYMQLYKEEI